MLPPGFEKTDPGRILASIQENESTGFPESKNGIGNLALGL
jgi:hypothetical protein